jgi:hypothetical protein
MIDPETRDVALAPRAADNASALAQWRIGEGWTIGATESRVMRSFQVVSDIERDLLIGGWRMAPDEPGLVSMTLIASGDASLARALDERDASVGFRFTGDLGVRPAASLAGFGVEGRFMLPEGFAMRVARGDALTFEMHADGRGRDESGAASTSSSRTSRWVGSVGNSQIAYAMGARRTARRKEALHDRLHDRLHEALNRDRHLESSLCLRNRNTVLRRIVAQTRSAPRCEQE